MSDPCNNPIPGNGRDYMKELEATAAKISDGHVSVLKFTTNWRVWFFTPEDRLDIEIMPSGRTFEEAAAAALEKAKLFNGSRSAKAKWERIKRTEMTEPGRHSYMTRDQIEADKAIIRGCDT